MSRHGTAPGRRLLRLALLAYPRSWRAEHGPEVLGVLDDLVDDGCPVIGEAASLVSHGLLVRMERLFGFWSATTRRRVSMLALVPVLVLSLAPFVLLDGPLLIGGVAARPGGLDMGTPVLGLVVNALALLGVALVLVRRPAAGRALLLVAAAAVLAAPLLSAATGLGRPPLIHLGVLGTMVLLAGLAPVHLEASGRIRLLTAAALTAVLVAAHGTESLATLSTARELYPVHPNLSEPAVLQDVSDVVVYTTVPVALALLLVSRWKPGWVIPLVAVAAPWWLQAGLFQLRRAAAGSESLLAAYAACVVVAGLALWAASAVDRRRVAARQHG